jgi:tetrapyrrole methylase family protein/MazG family protein
MNRKADTDEILRLFRSLVEIVAKLRGPDGCPWDKEQTQRTLTQYAIEEAFELADAIESGSQSEIKEELGDFLFQVILQAQVAADEGHFDLSEVIATLNEKMLRRHPHVFGDVTVGSTEDVWKNWEKTKAKEKAAKNGGKVSGGSAKIFSYPRNLPALQAAYKIGVKTERYSFDWENADEVFQKVEEEIKETREALDLREKNNNAETKAHLEHEIGDALFALSQLARHSDLEPEQCLREANRRFEKRFTSVLHFAAREYGEEFTDKEKFSTLSRDQMEELWSKAKKATE